MTELIVIAYDAPERAEEARLDLLSMNREYLVDVADAVVATVDRKGNVKLDQLVNLWTYGASGGAFWGLLVGLLFFHPLLGVLAGTTAGALSGALADYGIDDRFMKDVADSLQPGQAALFIMARTHATNRVLERLGSHGGRVMRTNLDPSQERRLREAFDRAHDESRRQQAAVEASPAEAH